MKHIYTCMFTSFLMSLTTFCLRAQNAGDLDLTFGTEGTSSIDFGTGQNQCAGLVIQSDQKIVVSGIALNTTYNPTLIRMNPDGSLDDTFGEGGIAVSEDVIASWQGATETLLIQPDGKLVCCYTRTLDNQSMFGVSRFNSDGSLDQSFGVNGNAYNSVTDFMDNALSMEQQEDGKIVVVGQGAYFNGDAFSMNATRFNADGTLDESFGTNGGFVFAQGTSSDQFHDVAQLSDGKLLMLALSLYSGYWEVVLLRLNEDGSVDETYGENGIANFNINNDNDTGRAMTLREDDSVIITGVSNEDDNLNVLLMCVDSNGGLDETFGDNGITITSLSADSDYGDKVMIADDGKILVAGYQNGSVTKGMVVCYTADGILDEAFGEGGVAYINNDYIIRLENIKQQADGKLVTTGYYANEETSQPDFTASRLWYDNTNAVTNLNFSNEQISIYPNPACNLIDLNWSKLKSSEIVQIDISDMNGRVICNKDQICTGMTLRFDVSELPESVYTVSIQQNNNLAYQLLVIVR